MNEGGALVIDNVPEYARLDSQGDDLPIAVFPTMVGRPKKPGEMG